ncbi:MAG: hypothetical protein NTV36_02100, partial [Candidatus Staskawiczbacteria bacterium]|nr:hypothetical protein [Candidatus Staskawiczbacteria bacterium]
MQKQKRISTLIGIIIISVAVFILFGTAFAYQYFFVKPEAVQTAGWKTYKSSLFDYEIKLPPQYKFSPGFISNGSSVTDIDSAGYSNENYAFGFEIFARSQDFIVKGCLKDSNGRDLTQTKNINGNIFYIEKERRPELGLKDSIPGSMQNSYNIMHNNKCYIIS